MRIFKVAIKLLITYQFESNNFKSADNIKSNNLILKAQYLS